MVADTDPEAPLKAMEEPPAAMRSDEAVFFPGRVMPTPVVAQRFKESAVNGFDAKMRLKLCAYAFSVNSIIRTLGLGKVDNCVVHIVLSTFTVAERMLSLIWAYRISMLLIDLAR